jgi:HK97 family phage portal protein
MVVPEGYPDMVFIEFTLKKTGKPKLIAEEDLLHFRFRFGENDYFGDSNEPLKEVVSIDSDLWSSVVHWSKNSAALRGVLAANGILKDEDIDKVNQRMKDTFLDTENSGGFLVVDNKFTYTAVNNNGVGIDRNYLTMTKQDIYEYFGVNEKLINGSASPQEIHAFNLLTIKPLLSMIEAELNRKLVTDRERGFNHHFLFVGDNLSHMSPTDKNSTVTMLSNLGCLTRNEIREGYGYFPIPGGDVLVYSKNFAEVGEKKDTNEDNETADENKEEQKEIISILFDLSIHTLI